MPSGSRCVILGSRSVRRTCNHRRRRTIAETERRAGVAELLTAKLDLSRVAHALLGAGDERTAAAPADRAACCSSRRRSLAAERRYGGHQPRNCAMPKPSPPPPSPSEGDEDPIWGDLFGFIRRPVPNPSPPADTPTSASPPQRKPPNKPRKPSTRRVPPVGAGNP